MDKITGKIATMSFDENESILYINIKEGADMTVENLKEHYEDIKKITKGKKYFALVDVKNIYTIDMGGLQYAASPEALKTRMAAAYCSPPLANRLNINSLKNLMQSSIPIHIFHSCESALTWLKELAGTS